MHLLDLNSTIYEYIIQFICTDTSIILFALTANFCLHTTIISTNWDPYLIWANYLSMWTEYVLGIRNWSLIWTKQLKTYL
jgi:hypothetical protein